MIFVLTKKHATVIFNMKTYSLCITRASFVESSQGWNLKNNCVVIVGSRGFKPRIRLEIAAQICYNEAKFYR